MSKRPRRNHSPAFKAKVAIDAIRATRRWRSCQAVRRAPQPGHGVEGQLLERAAGVFGGEARADEPSVDLKALHAKIGQLALENDFLEGALSKAGLLSVKR